MKVGAGLQRYPVLWRLGAFSLRVINQPRRAKQVERYLQLNDVRKLRLGSGRHTDAGWLSADLLPLSRSVVYMDARKPLPLPDGSFDFVVCEHMIEHVTLPSARQLLAEIHRILRPTGVLRLATPDFAQLARYVAAPNPLDPDESFHVTTMNEGVVGIPDDDRSNPVYMVNRAVRDWGHQFLYDEATLTRLLVGAGFRDIVRHASNQSHYPDLDGVERHHEEVGDRINRIETLVLEAKVTD
jgi:predicted SAM-dependent methyltransferase